MLSFRVASTLKETIFTVAVSHEAYGQYLPWQSAHDPRAFIQKVIRYHEGRTLLCLGLLTQSPA